MTDTSRPPLLLCCALAIAACGTADSRIDPGDLELRDVLGLSPDVAGAWDRDQRAAARRVIEAGLQAPASPGHAALGQDPAIERRVAKALAVLDVDRARHRTGALGVVDVAVGTTGAVATPRAATLQPRAAPPVDVQLRGWTDPGWAALPARGMDVLATLARDAGHRAGPVVVTPVPQLAVVAGYLAATGSEPARLVVNPVVLAALEPGDPAAVARAQGTAPPRAPAAAANAAANAAGNPYSFYGSVAECAAAQRDRCDACMAGGSCPAITDLGDGNAECTQLAANDGRGYYLICINLALAIDAVASCVAGAAGGAPACPRDSHASESISSLEANAGFLDHPGCAGPLDACLATLYGAPSGGFPGPGSGGGSARPPRNTSIDCSDSCSGDANCDASPDCELDGPSCDAPYDGTCADSNEQSGCDGSGTGGGDGGGGSCSGDSEDSCGSSDNSSCDSSDCGSSDSSCSSGDGGGGDCGGGGGGGDCGGGGGGDCGGGGGDCGGGGGGGDCNAAGKRGRAGMGLPVALAWAFLPIPLATFVRRRAERRRARAAGADQPASAEHEETP